MSAIAIAHVLPASALSDIEAAATISPKQFGDAVAAVQFSTLVYTYSGWVLATLFPVLASRYGIDLMSSPENDRGGRLGGSLGNTVFILTEAERVAYAERLDPDLFTLSDLRAAFEEFNATELPESGQFMSDGVRFLRAGLLQLNVDRVLLLVIG